MALNTCEAAQRRKSKSEETESQDCTVDTDTYVQGVRELVVSLTLSAEWGEADNDNERLSDAEFIIKEKELKQLNRYIQKI